MVPHEKEDQEKKEKISFVTKHFPEYFHRKVSLNSNLMIFGLRLLPIPEIILFQTDKFYCFTNYIIFTSLFCFSSRFRFGKKILVNTFQHAGKFPDNEDKLLSRFSIGRIG